MRWIILSFAALCRAQQGAFLARAIDAIPPGKALDVAMGQGRNSLFLARKGWDVTGYDVSKVGPSTAEASAVAARLTIHTVLKGHNDFDFSAARLP